MKRLSVIIPCYNEEKFIAKVLDNGLDQDYPLDLIEFLVVDGRSNDATRSIVASYTKTHTNIRLIDNPDRFAPHAFNRGIEAASGSIIYIWGAHSSYPRHYLSRLAAWLEKSGADNVGGILKTEARNSSAKAIAISKVLAHPLGVGNSSFRTGITEATEADTVPFGCYRRDVFDRFGYFDERLIRNQDIEHNRRIKRMGGQLLLVPDVQLTYYARATFRGLWKNNFGNGEWVVLAAKYTGTMDALSLRHFVPLGFVGYLAGLVFWWGLSLFFAIPTWATLLVLAPLILYFTGVGLVSFLLAWKERNLLFFPLGVLAFLVLHISYGLGSFWGMGGVFFD